MTFKAEGGASIELRYNASNLPTPVSTLKPDGGGPDFRKSRWGMSKAEVIASEGKPGAEQDGKLLYATEVAGLNAAAIFEFDKYSEPNEYLINSAKWVEGLKAKYGTPTPQIEWVNEMFKEDRTKYGLAISAGHLKIRNVWTTPRTNIVQFLVGSNYTISMGIVYGSKALQAEFEQQKKAVERSVF
jgi:hypothetical protein